MEVSQHKKNFCEFCGKYVVKRKVVGIWGCKDCGKVKAGGAYTLKAFENVLILSSEVSGDREVQRTMLELLNRLDGFSSHDQIKVIVETNRANILDHALMRSSRLDRKIEFPHPTEEARA